MKIVDIKSENPPNRFQKEVVEPLSAPANLKGSDGIVELHMNILNVNHAIN